MTEPSEFYNVTVVPAPASETAPEPAAIDKRAYTDQEVAKLQELAKWSETASVTDREALRVYANLVRSERLKASIYGSAHAEAVPDDVISEHTEGAAKPQLHPLAKSVARTAGRFIGTIRSRRLTPPQQPEVLIAEPEPVLPVAEAPKEIAFQIGFDDEPANIDAEPASPVIVEVSEPEEPETTFIAEVFGEDEPAPKVSRLKKFGALLVSRTTDRRPSLAPRHSRNHRAAAIGSIAVVGLLLSTAPTVVRGLESDAIGKTTNVEPALFAPEVSPQSQNLLDMMIPNTLAPNATPWASPSSVPQLMGPPVPKPAPVEMPQPQPEQIPEAPVVTPAQPAAEMVVDANGGSIIGATTEYFAARGDSNPAASAENFVANYQKVHKLSLRQFFQGDHTYKLPGGDRGVHAGTFKLSSVTKTLLNNYKPKH